MNHLVLIALIADIFVWPMWGRVTRAGIFINTTRLWIDSSTGCVLHEVNWRWTWICSCLHMAILLNFTRVFLGVRRVLHSVAVSHRWRALFPVMLYFPPFTPRVVCLVYSWSFEGFPLVSHVTTTRVVLIFPTLCIVSLQHPSVGVRSMCVLCYHVWFRPSLPASRTSVFLDLVSVFCFCHFAPLDSARPNWTAYLVLTSACLGTPWALGFLFINKPCWTEPGLQNPGPAQAAYNKLLLHNWANSYKCACLPHNTTMQAYTLMYTLIL